jgi:oligopeptide transport system substrate-binding protein
VVLRPKAGLYGCSGTECANAGKTGSSHAADDGHQRNSILARIMPAAAPVPALKHARASALCLMLLLAACGGNDPEGARLTVSVVGDVGRPGGLAQRLVAEATRPTLIERNGAGQIVPGLASSWRFVDDGRSLILRLRPAKWSDGEPLVAKDVVAAFRRAGQRREPALARAGLAGATDVVERGAPVTRLGIFAPISRVVEIRLAVASPLLLGWLADPQLGVTRAGEKPMLADYVVTGPVQRRLLRRRSIAATDNARPAQIVVSAAEDSATAVGEFRRGETDIVMGEGLSGLGEARNSIVAQSLRIDPVWGIYGYVINTLRGPLADPRVRLALAMAVDRPALLQRFGIPAMVPVESMLPPALAPQAPAPRAGIAAAAATNIAAAIATATTAATNRKATPTKPPTPTAPTAPTAADAAAWASLPLASRRATATALMAAAGFTAEKPLRLVLLLPPGRDHRSIAENIGVDWSAINVVLAVSEVGAGTIDQLVARGEFDLAVTEAALPVADPVAMLMRWRCDSAGAYCNPAFDTLIAAANAAAQTDQSTLVSRAVTALNASPPMVPLFTPVRWALVAANVDGWTSNAAGSHPLARLAVTGRN